MRAVSLRCRLSLTALCVVIACACDDMLCARRVTGIAEVGALVMSFEGAHNGAPYWAAMAQSEGKVHTFYLYYLRTQQQWALGNTLGGSTILAGIHSNSRTPEAAVGRWSLQQRERVKGFRLPELYLPGRMEPTDNIFVHCDPQIRSMRSLPLELARTPRAPRETLRQHTSNYPEVECSKVHCPKLRRGCVYKSGPLEPSGCPRFPCKFSHCADKV